MKKTIILIFLFLLVIPLTFACEIRSISHNKLLIGDTDGVFQFQVFDPEAQAANDTVIHASCHLNIYSYGESYDGGAGFAGMNGSILTTQFYPNPEQLHYTNYLGDVVFHVDMSGYEWDTDKEYAWQVECYCLDLSPATDNTHMDLHTCFYGSDGSQTGYLGCSAYGNFTTNEKFILKKEPTALWGIALIVMGVLFIIAYLSRNTKDDIMKGLFSLIVVGLLFAAMDLARVFAIESAASGLLVKSIVIMEITTGTLMLAVLFFTFLNFVKVILIKMGKLPGNTEK